MTDGIHSCGYHCQRPACVIAQRSELMAAMREALQLIAQAEREDFWPAYANRVDAARDVLRAKVGEVK